MKRHTSPARTYRKTLGQRSGETSFQVVLEHSDLFIVAQNDLSSQALDCLRRLRSQLKSYIALNPGFAQSLAPLTVPDNAPSLVKEMAEAAAICGVGPMASVAGALAEAVARELAPLSSEVLVENGGDLFLLSTKERKVGLLADPESETCLGLRFPANAFPLSLCASSASIGHSLSLGRGDLVVVRARRASLADAAATALCNRLRGKNDLKRLTDQAQAWRSHGVAGLLAQVEGELLVWGEMELALV